jgi:hypothetical protein
MLLLPSTALATDPTAVDPGDAAALEAPLGEPSPSFTPTVEPDATEQPATDPTDEPTANPTDDATPDPTGEAPSATAEATASGSAATPSDSPDSTGSPVADSPAPSATDGSTAPPDATTEPSGDVTAPPTPAPPTSTTGHASHGVSTAAESSGSLSGYRYTISAASLHEARDTSSAVLLSLAADTQLSVSESTIHGGVEWITATRTGTTGYIPASQLSATSALKELVVTRYTLRTTALYTAILGDVIRSVRATTYVRTEAAALDYLGRRWVRITYSEGGTTYRGFGQWWETTTVPVTASGTWTVLNPTTLKPYPYTEARVVLSLGAGTQVARRATATDAYGVGWTKGTVGSTWGWVRSADLTPPYKQYIWNRRNPVTQQYTNYWCVPASVQTELNIALNRTSTSYSYQKSIYSYGRRNLGYWTGGVGLDPQAWQRALSYFSTYRVDYTDSTFSTYSAAIKAGALQMRKTGLPVGLLVYYGNHAWTMIGYTATADPLKTSAFKVTGVYVAAPFVRWTDPPAGTYYGSASFARKMTPYIEQVRWTRWNGLYTIILPVG